MEPENPGLEMVKAFGEGAGKESAGKFAEFIGGLVPFWGTKKKAVDVYVREIEQSNLSPEAKMIAIANVKKTYKELKNQTAIIDAAFATINGKQNPSPGNLQDVDDELVSRLIDAGKFVSDEELQLLWGNVLAGEFEQPGSTPKNAVRILSEISKEHATVFSKLCSMQAEILADSNTSIRYTDLSLMIFLSNRSLQNMNITLTSIQELEQLGLINFTDTGYYNIRIPHRIYPYIHIVFGDYVLTAIHSEDDFPTGQVILTEAGRCLSRFVPVHYNQQHVDGIKSYLKNNWDMKFLPKPMISIKRKTIRTGRSIVYEYKRRSTIPTAIQEQKIHYSFIQMDRHWRDDQCPGPKSLPMNSCLAEMNTESGSRDLAESMSPSTPKPRRS